MVFSSGFYRILDIQTKKNDMENLESISSFDSLGLSEPLLRSISEHGYKEPSPIQAKTIPFILSNRDIMAAAQTGTGKTAAFALPILHHLINEKSNNSTIKIRALVLQKKKVKLLYHMQCFAN